MKYWRTFQLALQSQLLSIMNLIAWFITMTITPAMNIFIWLTILGNQTSVGGFTRSDFIIYFLYTMVGWWIVGGTFANNIGSRIKEGGINTTLLKPYDIVFGQALEEQAWKVMSVVVALPALIVFLFIFKDFLVFNLSYQQLAILIISLILGGINFALMDAIFGITAFWVTDTWPVVMVGEILQALFGGLMVPLALMPTLVLTIANLLPFKYMFYVPISIFLNKSSNILYDVFLQLLYVIVLFMIYKVIWKAGIKEYEGVGA